MGGEGVLEPRAGGLAPAAEGLRAEFGPAAASEDGFEGSGYLICSAQFFDCRW